MRVGWIYSPFFIRHQTGSSHPERPERLEAILSGLQRDGLLGRMVELAFDSAPVEVLEWVHEPAYVALVRMACEQGMSFIGCRETNVCPDSYDVARLAAGGVLAACDAVVSQRVSRAFCAVRPPGHHADSAGGGGFCLFNNVALAAEYLRRRYGLERVAIVDWDVHHGNGTQRIFEARDDVLFISLHETPDTQYPHTGYESERGVGPGDGFTINCPMPPGSGDADYRRAFAEHVMPALEAYQPACVLISAGFDAVAADDVANLNLHPSSFAWMTEQLAGLADRHCRGSLISVLEGGYDLPSLSRSVSEHVRVLLTPDQA
jgi:acetoin utilization deacetylase AcuC-like enzyme